jgi:hypothetical protein
MVQWLAVDISTLDVLLKILEHLYFTFSLIDCGQKNNGHKSNGVMLTTVSGALNIYSMAALPGMGWGRLTLNPSLNCGHIFRYHLQKEGILTSTISRSLITGSPKS